MRDCIIKLRAVKELETGLHTVVAFKFQKGKTFRLPTLLFCAVTDGLRVYLRKVLGDSLVRSSVGQIS